MENINSKKKIYFYIIVVLFVVLLALFLADILKVKKQQNINKGRAIASVNGFVVYEGDLKDRLDSLNTNGNIKVEDLPESVLKAMVLEVVVNNKIDQEARKKHYQKDPEVLKYVEDYKKGLIREKFLDDNIYSKITEDDVKKEYNDLVANLNGKEERKIKHILVETEDEIERVRRNVLRTGNFERIATQKSIDTVSGQNGGDIGYVLKEELDPEFANVAFMLKVGEISKPVKTAYGWHIIKVEDARPAQFLPYESVKDTIKQRLQQQAIQNYLISLTKNSDVEFKIEIKAPNAVNNKIEAGAIEVPVENNTNKK